MKGILFKTEMVQANAAGLKTMTRRLAGLNFLNMHMQYNVYYVGCKEDLKVLESPFGKAKVIDGLGAVFYFNNNHYHLKCPYGKPGNLLYTRETWSEEWEEIQIAGGNWSNVSYQGTGGYLYKADGVVLPEIDSMTFGKWKPAIHMPADAARHFHRIKKIRVERIMDITAEDAIAEGIERWTDTRLKSKPTRYKLYSIDEEDKHDPPLYASCPIDSFRSLWQMINAAPKPIQVKLNGKLHTTGYIVYPWGDPASMKPWHGVKLWRGKPLTVVGNPWVWVVEYENVPNPTNQ